MSAIPRSRSLPYAGGDDVRPSTGRTTMDSKQFDALTRALSSRRSIVGASVAALLGLAGANEIAAHDAGRACKRLNDPKRRRACLRRARAHNRRHRPQPTSPACVPQPLAVTCAGRCGTVLNNCNQATACFLCPTGKDCLANGTCARPCSTSLVCPNLCACPTVPTVEGGQHCISFNQTCAVEMKQVCSSTTECPVGQHCQETACSGPNRKRCVSVCPS